MSRFVHCDNHAGKEAVITIAYTTFAPTGFHPILLMIGATAKTRDLCQECAEVLMEKKP